MKSIRSIFQKTVFIALFIFSTGNFLFAQDQSVVPISEAAGKIRFAGAEGDMLVFEVELDSLPLKGTSLKIFDDQGNIIFEERVPALNHIRRYKIARNDMKQITFTVSGKAFSFSQSFVINYKIEERLEVKKVK